MSPELARCVVSRVALELSRFGQADIRVHPGIPPRVSLSPHESCARKLLPVLPEIAVSIILSIGERPPRGLNGRPLTEATMWLTQPAPYLRAICPGIVAGILAIAAPAAAQDVEPLMSKCAGEHNETDDEMIAACTSLIALPQLDARQRSLAYSYRASGYQGKNDLERALADANEAIKVDASSSRAFYRRGDVYKNLHQDERALTDFNESIRLDPKVPVYFVDRSNIYLDLKQFDPAIRDLDEALRLDPADEINAMVNRCNVLTFKGDFDAALSDCRKAIQMHPRESYPLSGLGFLYYKWGKLDESIATYDAALAAPDWSSYDPYERAYPLYGRGLAKSKKGDKAGGEADMAAAIAIAKSIAFDFE